MGNDRVRIYLSFKVEITLKEFCENSPYKIKCLNEGSYIKVKNQQRMIKSEPYIGGYE